MNLVLDELHQFADKLIGVLYCFLSILVFYNSASYKQNQAFADGNGYNQYFSILQNLNLHFYCDQLRIKVLPQRAPNFKKKCHLARMAPKITHTTFFIKYKNCCRKFELPEQEYAL